MPYFQFEEDVDVYEILDALSSNEYDELLDKIVASGDLIRPGSNMNSISGGEFREALDKLWKHRLELSMEDEKTILEIAKKV